VTSGFALALFGVAFLTFRRRIIESEMLILKDSRGRQKIAMSADHGIIFFDENMHPKMQANVFAGQPVIYMRDEKESILLVVGKDGAKMTAFKNDWSSSSTNIQCGEVLIGLPDRAQLSMSAKADSGHVLLSRANDRCAASLALIDSGATATIGRINGAGIVISGAQDGNLGIVVQNEKTEPTVVFGSIDTSAHISFFGENGQKIASYPNEESERNYARAVARSQTR
jgi:hypothetical protein